MKGHTSIDKNNKLTNDSCGNCWGYQEWEGEIIEKVISLDNKKSFVVKAAEKV